MYQRVHNGFTQNSERSVPDIFAAHVAELSTLECVFFQEEFDLCHSIG